MIDETQIKSLLKRIKANETVMSAIFGGAFFVILAIGLSAYFRFFTNKLRDFYTGVKNASLQVVQTLPNEVNLNALPLRYVVQKGDSTWKIAQAFYGSGYNYVDVEKENNLVKDQQLIEGTILVIPKVQPLPMPTGGRVRTHKTTASDTLWKLAQQYYNNGYAWTKIYEANKSLIKNPDRLEKDLTLVIPE